MVEGVNAMNVTVKDDFHDILKVYDIAFGDAVFLAPNGECKTIAIPNSGRGCLWPSDDEFVLASIVFSRKENKIAVIKHYGDAMSTGVEPGVKGIP